MMAPLPDLDDAPLGALFGRLIDDGKRLARAEVAIQVATIRTRADRSKIGVALLIVALLLVQAAFIVIVAAFGVWLRHWIGPAGGLAAAAVIAIVVAGLLAKVAAGRLALAAEPVV